MCLLGFNLKWEAGQARATVIPARSTDPQNILGIYRRRTTRGHSGRRNVFYWFLQFTTSDGPGPLQGRESVSAGFVGNVLTRRQVTGPGLPDRPMQEKGCPGLQRRSRGPRAHWGRFRLTLTSRRRRPSSSSSRPRSPAWPLPPAEWPALTACSWLSLPCPAGPAPASPAGRKRGS